MFLMFSAIVASTQPTNAINQKLIYKAKLGISMCFLRALGLAEHHCITCLTMASAWCCGAKDLGGRWKGHRLDMDKLEMNSYGGPTALAVRLGGTWSNCWRQFGWQRLCVYR